MAAIRSRGLPSAPAALSAILAVLTLAVLSGHTNDAELLAVGLFAFGLGLLTVRVIGNWSWLICCLAGVDLLIPEDDRYVLKGVGNGLGFQLEPYRILVLIMIIGWITGLMIDPRVRPRKTKFDGPLLLITLGVLGSDVFNAGRVAEASSSVMKAVSLFLFLTLLLYVIASTVRTRETIERILQMLVGVGCIVGVAALVEREASFNVFNHLHRLLPMFTFNAAAGGNGAIRNGAFRAVASAGHPIELSNEMAMLTPIAAYLAIRGRKWWWGSIPILVMGNFTTGSRTGMVGLLTVLVVCLCMRPRETARFWPALIPILAVVQAAIPGAITGTFGEFFPKGGLIAQQSETFAANGRVQDANRLSRIGPQLRDVFDKHNQFFGQGYGTRLGGRAINQTLASPENQTEDDQWLVNLLDTGLVGFAGWLWLFGRVIRKLARRARFERHTQEGWLPVCLAASIACYGVSMYFYDANGFVQATVVLYLLIGLASAYLWLQPAGARQRRSARPPRLILPQLHVAGEPVPVDSGA